MNLSSLKQTTIKEESFIVKNKNTADWTAINTKLKKKLKRNFYDSSREWNYKGIKASILVEKFLGDRESKIPNDYKFFCSNGKIIVIQVDEGKDSLHTRTFYDINWNKLNITKGKPFSSNIQKKPLKFNEMIDIVKKLIVPFIFCRVDLYEINGAIFVGELTFHPGNGVLEFAPTEANYHFGKLLDLPKTKYIKNN